MADKKGGRRNSLMALAKRVKQFEQGKGDKPASTPAVKSSHLDRGRPAYYSGGAEIPDIPLRRNTRTINNVDLGLDSLAALETLLTAGLPQIPQHAASPNNQLPGPSQLRIDDSAVGLDQDFNGEGRLLYPVSECSTEWESNSLPDVPDEAGQSPDPSLRPRSSASPSAEYNTQLSPRVCAPVLPSECSVDIPTHGAAPFQAGLQPKLIVPSLTVTDASRTEASVLTEPAIHTALPALQAKGVDDLEDGLQPVDEETVEPGSFDLIVPSRPVGLYSLERRSELLFSTEHMRVIFADPIFLTRFTSFVAIYRPPSSMALLNYALDAVKAIRAMDWMNGIISKSLRPEGKPQHSFFTGPVPELTTNESLRRKAAAAMEALARDELPAYVTHVWTDIVEVSMKRKITGSMPTHLRDMSEGLAEVFCISDPSRPDNPIVFASEEFHRTTQYGPDYVLGRNCRFLQGPKTNSFAVQRIREMLKQGKEHYETFLNYRRDGLPFMNLLMCTPLFDSRGQVRYQLGAQVDVSGLAKDCSGLESLRRLVDRDDEDQLNRHGNGGHGTSQRGRRDSGTDFDDIPGGSLSIPGGTPTMTPRARPPRENEPPKDEFRLMAEMLNRNELDTVRRFGGRMHRSQQEQIQHVESLNSANWHKTRVVLHDSSPPISPPVSPPVNSANIQQQQQQQQQRKVIVGDERGNLTVANANGNRNVAARTHSPAGVPFPSLPQTQMNSNNNNGGEGGVPRAPAIFENYLVVRPYPSLRILFASRPMRVPGILQSHLMSRIGGSQRIHDELEQAFAAGQSVTAKVKWISGTDLRNANAATMSHHPTRGQGHASGLIPDHGSGSTSGSHNGRGATTTAAGTSHHVSNASPQHDTVGMDGRPRWIHCTPLASTTGAVGVWVVVIVDEESEASERAARRRHDFSTGTHPIYSMKNNDEGSPHSTSTITGERAGERQQQRRQQPRQWDEMSLTDFASMNRLPEDEDLRQHLREMYEETRRRERGGGSTSTGGGTNGGGTIGGGGDKGAAVRPGSRAGAGGGSAHEFRSRFEGSAGRSRSSTPDLMGTGADNRP